MTPAQHQRLTELVEHLLAVRPGCGDPKCTSCQRQAVEENELHSLLAAIPLNSDEDEDEWEDIRDLQRLP